MAGIGPICTNNRDLLKRAEYRSGLSKPKSELEIFCSLCVGRVLFRKSNRTLYFVDAPSLSITELIHQVFKSINQQPDIKQLYMDEHNLINAALCITLTIKQQKLVLVALRVSGIHIDMSS
ncbi:MAG: hypothetical protein GY744_05550 [Gammaproteobacteria bacterium]|nr:hypothetical protein [Gammaproteobacteria bacterium]